MQTTNVYDALPKLDVQFDDDQLATYFDWVNAAGAERERQGFDSASFCAGAMVVLYAMGMQKRIPAMWILGPISGRNVFTPDKPVQVKDGSGDGEEA